MPTKMTYCLCGSTIKLTTVSQMTLDGVMFLWWREHQGDGHGPATAAQARRARDRGTAGDRPVHEHTNDEGTDADNQS